jgi:hypothetical protein
MELGVSSWTF